MWVRSRACLAASGHEVTFVEVNPVKVAQLNAGASPVVEKGLSELVRECHRQGRLQAVNDVQLSDLARLLLQPWDRPIRCCAGPDPYLQIPGRSGAGGTRWATSG
jgi:UDP-glucose/GDP-mannose dehydrogenase family, NAD binding domain